MFTIKHIHIIRGHSDEKLDKILNLQKKILMNIEQLSAKVDDLQAALDSEQEQIATAIAALQVEVANLNALIVDGGTEAQRQAVADKIDSVINDLKATIPDVVPDPEPPTE